jgi:hypothetical protein
MPDAGGAGPAPLGDVTRQDGPSATEDEEAGAPPPTPPAAPQPPPPPPPPAGPAPAGRNATRSSGSVSTSDDLRRCGRSDDDAEGAPAAPAVAAAVAPPPPPPPAAAGRRHEGDASPAKAMGAAAAGGGGVARAQSRQLGVSLRASAGMRAASGALSDRRALCGLRGTSLSCSLLSLLLLSSCARSRAQASAMDRRVPREQREPRLVLLYPARARCKGQ